MKKTFLLKTMLLLCTFIVGVANSVWGEDQTLTITQSALGLTGSYSTNAEKTIDGITFVHTDLMKNSSNIQVKASSGVIYNKTAFPTNIKSVEITHSGTPRPTTILGSSDGTNWTQVATGSGSITGNFTNKGYKYLKITRGSNAAYWTQVVITYEEAAAASPLTSISLSGTYPTSFNEGDAFSNEGMIVTATYEDQSSKNVTNSATFSGYNMNSVGSQEVTVSYTEGDITKTTKYNITIFELQKHTVSFADGGSVTEESAGAGIILPSRDAIGDYTFVGWSETNIADETTTAPTIIPTGDYKPEADITLYPVYSRTEGASGIQNKTASVTISDYASANGWTNSNQYTTIVADENIIIEGADNGNNSKFYSSSTPHNWRFYASDKGNFTISTKNGVLTSVTITYKGNTLKYNDNEVTSATPILVSDASATFAVSGTKDNSQVSAIEVNYTIGNQGTTYYWSAPVASAVARPEITVAANPFTFSTTATITCATDGAAIKYSYDGENWSDYTAPLTITETKTIYAKAILGNDESLVATVTATKNFVEPTVTINATGITNTNVFVGTEAGSLSASVTYNDASVDDAVVTWSGNNDAVATINASTGAVTLVGAGSVTFTATYAGNDDYSEKAATYDMTVINEDLNAPGKQNNPYTVAQARAAIDANEETTGVYATGIVSEIVTAFNSQYGNITYNISADGETTSDQLQAYRGKSYDGNNFTSADDIQVGDVVVIFGNLKKYNSVYEFDQGNQLVSKITKEVPSFSLNITEKSLDAYSHETVDVTLTTNTDGAITCESSDPDVATVALKSAGVYTITAQTVGTATITISSKMSDNFKAASATISITVTDNRVDAGISFAEDAIEMTWGESFTGLTLTNTNSLAVTWSSTDETVATVNATTGVVNVLKAGTTTIKATYPGDASYQAAVVSYDLTINKATADLSYTETSFEIMINDDSFVAPALNNPNTLTGITYSSNNTNLVVVDENTGELVYDPTIAGTATITASFAGNDWFKSGNAKYTITIIDPFVKGSKYNPYTVAEVIDGIATGSGIYVKGFIVGEYVGNKTNPRTSGFTTDTNIAIADAFTSSPVANAAIPIALPTNALKNTWGCKTTEGVLLGHEIMIKGNCESYFGTNGIKNVTEITAVSIPVTISNIGWATFCSEYALDFTDVTSLTAYTATVDGNAVKFTKVTGKVPANTGLLVSGETTNVPVCASAEPVANIMEGVTAETVKDANTIFVLKKGDNGLGFYKNTNDFTVRANSAYIPATSIPSGANARGFISLDDEATGIKNLTPTLSEGEGAIYTLDGGKVAIAPLGMGKNVQLKKGVYVVNGKKVIIK